MAKEAPVKDTSRGFESSGSDHFLGEVCCTECTYSLQSFSTTDTLELSALTLVLVASTILYMRT